VVAVVLVVDTVAMVSHTTTTVVEIFMEAFMVAVLVVLVLLTMVAVLVEMVRFVLFGDQTVLTQQQILATLQQRVKE
jgi:hypothetical protein